MDSLKHNDFSQIFGKFEAYERMKENAEAYVSPKERGKEVAPKNASAFALDAGLTNATKTDTKAGDGRLRTS
jgi:hypothetical protein